MYILEAVPDFVKILGYGLSGFAFLLMFFAYMLLRQVISKSTQNQMIFKSIWAFMGLSCLLNICIGVFSYITGDYKKKELQENEVTIQKQQNGLEVLKYDQKLDSLVKNAVVTNIENDPAKETTKTLDSLNRPDLSKEVKTRLSNKYVYQTGELSKVSTNVVKRNM